jgi:hypothetical protein
MASTTQRYRNTTATEANLEFVPEAGRGAEREASDISWG